MQPETIVAPQELFALTDEQILEIEPESKGAESSAQDFVNNGQKPGGDRESRDRQEESTPRAEALHETRPDLAKTETSDVAAPEPPEWLAQRMRDPWNGEEAREFWAGVQRQQQDGAAYREIFAKPEEARAAANRARMLDEFDGAYFGAPGKPAEELSVSRAQLAQRMMREDPAAFREMVFAGLRAIEGEKSAPEKQITATTPGTQGTPATSNNASALENAHRELAGRYATFEKAANDDLERSVGAVITRTLEQALPKAANGDSGAIKVRLNATIRQDIEKTLQSDQQLGEQVSRLLASRSFDDATRTQIVRLIGDRAAQLVPSAAKRVLGDWTQTAMAAHRTRTNREDEVGARNDLMPAGKALSTSTKENYGEVGRVASKTRAVDYRKFSDEQILNMG
jgi:hypothetical protein